MPSSTRLANKHNVESDDQYTGLCQVVEYGQELGFHFDRLKKHEWYHEQKVLVYVPQSHQPMIYCIQNQAETQHDCAASDGSKVDV